MDSAEFSLWRALHTIRPIGEEAADIRSAIVACVIANSNRGKGQKAFKPQDFMPTFDKPKRQQTADEMEAVFKAFVGMHNSPQNTARR